MERLCYPDKQLAEDSIEKESLIAEQHFWKVMDAFKVKLEKYSLEEL
jgi:hypothetical protein